VEGGIFKNLVVSELTMLEINGKFADGLGFMLGNQLPRELGWCGNQIVDGVIHRTYDCGACQNR
jgi:hypothetical protein